MPLRRISLIAIAVSLCTVGWVAIWAQRPQADRAAADTATALANMPAPEYTPDGKLLRPVGFEKWIVVGTSVGLSYSDGAKSDADNPGQFHNVYMQPQAFDQFVRTGEFPEKTIFVVTNNPSQATEGLDDLNRHGFFAGAATGLEVAVKDRERFADGWAYFMYHDQVTDSTNNEQAAEGAFARQDCFDCHAEHGKTDNVFTQFYSVLTTARAQQLTSAAKARP